MILVCEIGGRTQLGSWRDRRGCLLMRCWQSIYKSQDVVQVNIPAESGEMGVLANHVPSIEQLKPGLVEVIEESGGSKQFFRTSTQAHQQCSKLIKSAVSGGFAIVQPNSELSINAVEGFPLEDFSIENVRSQLSEAQKIAGGSGSEADIAEAKIEIEVSPYKNVVCGVSDGYIGVGELAGRSQVKVHPWFWRSMKDL